MLSPFFGDLPPWMDKFSLPKGYDFLLDQDSEKFKERVRTKLHIDCPILSGRSKGNDYRCALGLLYEEEIKDYDFWGTVDLDMIFSDNIDDWFSDEVLTTLDIWSNHNKYVCGPWTLYRNTEKVGRLFMDHPQWKEIMSLPETTAWVEGDYSRLVEQSGLRYKYSFHQGFPWTKTPNLKKENGVLYQDNIPIPMFHFRHSKPKWPLV